MRAAMLVLVSALPLLGACDLSMQKQEKGSPQSSEALWPGGPPRAAPPEGTIATDQGTRDAALATPPPLTAALMNRGQERYEIFCTECHGAKGRGDGMIVRRGFPQPPSFHTARLVAAPPAYIVDVITHGHGVMYSYADRVDPRDRWAVAAYIKALQRLPERAR